MSDEIKSHRVDFEGMIFDSQLEADWYATLKSWGLAVTHHPGSIRLPGDSGGWWEPDFLVTGWDGVEVLAEAKGPHDDRLWKAAEVDVLHPELGGVVILRPGVIVPGSTNETAGAVWHGTQLWGPEWVVGFQADGACRMTRDTMLYEPQVRVSAERTWVRPSAYGLAMVKARGRRVE